MKKLDYEMYPVMEFIYTATDGGGRSKSLQVRIQVTNYNDKAPLFSNSVYRTSVMEGSRALQPPLNVSVCICYQLKLSANIIFWKFHIKFFSICAVNYHSMHTKINLYLDYQWWLSTSKMNIICCLSKLFEKQLSIARNWSFSMISNISGI